MWDAKWLLLKIFAVVNCREDRESKISQWWEKRPVRCGHAEMNWIPTNGRFPIKGRTLSPAYSHLSPWQAWDCAGTYSFFTFFSVYRFLLFVCPLPPISNICVWVKAGHSRREIWVHPSSSPLISRLLFMSVNVLLYLMYICQRNAGPSSRHSHFPLPSWDIPDLNSMSLHS